MPPERPSANYLKLVEARRALAIPGYASYADVGLEGPWTTPYHLAACSPTGPVLLTYNFLDASSAIAHREELLTKGYLSGMPFNRVLDLALQKAKLERRDLYVTHAFHLLPATRSAAVPVSLVDLSFDQIGRWETVGRRVIALGETAARVCRRHGITHTALPHLSARGLTFERKADLLAAALNG